MLNVYFVGAVLVALLASILPALAHKEHRNFIRESWRHPLRLALGVLTGTQGVIVVTYCHPILGAPTTTAPTASQAAQIPEIAAQVFFADTDSTTAAVIQHNWGLPASFPTWLWPQVFFNKSVGLAGTDSSFATNFTFNLSNTNAVYMSKNSVGAGSGGTYNVYLRRPHSLGQ